MSYKTRLTNCLRGIRNAWHFWHAVSFVIKLVCGRFCVDCSPLSRALCIYAHIDLMELDVCIYKVYTLSCCIYNVYIQSF
ncbi:TPA: DUF3265 domain-containing protein [Vibrio parahaemolyticus]|nr:DUF3265 domain-containing protein [Vibrio parahaemolyticus]